MNKKKTPKLKTLLPYALGGAIGIAIGLLAFYGGYKAGAAADEGSSLGILLVSLLPAIASLFIGLVLHIILHEAGHLIAGLLSGYKFISFTVGNIMVIKENGRLKIKRFSIAGAGGQCLMSPPEPTNNTYPFKLYNLGGGLMNFIASGIFIAIFLLTKSNQYAGDIFITLAAIGVVIGLMNLLPLKIGGISTDGQNIISLTKNEQSRKALWCLLTANARIATGERGKDLPTEWFVFPEDYDFNDAISANLAIMGAGRLIACHEFDQAKALAEKILNKGDKLIGLLKNEAQCELLFLEIITEKNPDKIARLFTPELEKYIKASKTHLSKHRLMYAYEKLVSEDDEKARKCLETFNKICLTYPYTGDRECEKELIGVVDTKISTSL
ncbi:MAG: M50 family metallopeptidase [Oscillospiraceae bacterium]|nr:M50 family metallopeptidase [Oscillospiraceae bacterium]